jgi:hypothetical protein
MSFATTFIGKEPLLKRSRPEPCGAVSPEDAENAGFERWKRLEQGWRRAEQVGPELRRGPLH